MKLIVSSLPEKEGLVVNYNPEYHGIFFHQYAQQDKRWQRFCLMALDWFRKFPVTPIYEGRSFNDIFTFHGIPAWDFFHEILWEEGLGVFNAFYNAISYMDIIEEYGVDEVEIRGIMEYPVGDIFRNRRIRTSDKSIKPIQNKPSNLKRMLSLKASSIFNRYRRGVPLVITSHNLANKELHPSDARYLHGLVQKNYQFVSLEKNATQSNLSWYGFVPVSSILESRGKLREYKLLFSKISQTSEYKRLTNLYGGILKHVIDYIPAYLCMLDLTYKTVENMISRTMPSEIFTIDGMGIRGKMVNYICNRLGIPVYFPQLGIVSPLPVHNVAFDANCDRRLLPIFLAWDNHTKNIIASKGWPLDKIIIQGYWKKKIKRNQDIDISKNILYATCANTDKMTWIASVPEEVHLIKELRKEIPKEYTIFVKIHPSLDYSDYDINGVRLIKDGTIEDIMSKCSMLITKTSASYLDASYNGIPAYSINLTSNVNVSGFPITNIKDLTGL